MNKILVKKYYEEYFKRMVFVAYDYVKDWDEAQNLVQDIFVHLIQKEAEVILNPEGYFFRATRYKCLDHLKSSVIREKHHHAIKSQNNLCFDLSVEKNELETFLFRCIDELPTQCRRVFTLSRIDGKNNAEIAELLSLSKRTVETHISNALKLLRKKLENHYSDSSSKRQ